MTKWKHQVNMTTDQKIMAYRCSTSLFFRGSFRHIWEIHCHQLCLKRSTTNGARFCSDTQSKTNLHMACYILTAFHKSQDRFLVIVAMKWYHQTEKDQRTRPEKLTLPKTEPAATTISLANNLCQAKPGLTNTYKTDMTMRLMSQAGSVNVALWGIDKLLHSCFFIC